MISSTHRMNHVGVIHTRRNAWTDAQNKFQIQRTNQGTSELIKHCRIELTETASPESKRREQICCEYHSCHFKTHDLSVANIKSSCIDK